MAFDQNTRTRVQRFVGEAKDLLSREFTRQLQNDYGMDPGTGEVSDPEKLTHLDDAGMETALLLRDSLAHYLASSPTTDKKELLDRIIREQAFTVLNRLCALRMAESRDIVIESITNGYNSKGFQLYFRLAGSALGETAEGYKCYLFSLFDELAMDLAVLFDRYSPMGRLFPRDTVLLEIIDKINHEDLANLWSEDETIGWIYQYFNSKEERKKMRDESAAPRNSRELAVRNQFFTPRYVVEFLTDNTLGRIWYEMRQGGTALKEDCRYLVRRPNEIFLKPGEKAPVESGNETDLTQEELLKKTVYIEYRPKKDPRDLRVLDPACGSGHFLLYAFDLLERIYNEAWDDTEGLISEVTGQTIQTDFENHEDFTRAIPKLIIEHNLHGIDIDVRAVQIAALALWMRAQKTWKNIKIKPSGRPQIAKSNIVTAEPMPGEQEMKEEFTASLKPRVLGQLVDVVFDKMKLAGEAGSLLKIEEEIKEAVAEAQKQWLEQPKAEQLEMFGKTRQPKPVQQDLRFDFKGVTDERFWNQAEERILDALKNYAEQAENGHTVRRRLFAEDAARGFAFIDLCRKRYDVVLMNPPFGDFSKKWKAKAKVAYPNSSNDILGAFVERFLFLLVQHGRIGAITSRACFFLTSFTDWRENVVLNNSIQLIADLGQGVMDDAMVEAATYVIERSETTKGSLAVFRAIAEEDRQKIVELCINAHNNNKSEPRLFLSKQNSFNQLPESPFVYWIDKQTIHQFTTTQTFEPDIGEVRVGLQTGDDPRFVRTTWEVAPEDTVFCYYPSNGENYCSFDDPIVQAYFLRRNKGKPRWAFHVKAGASQPWYSPITLKVNWAADGLELLNFTNAKGKLRSRPQNIRFYYRPGFSWTLRAVRFYPYVIPSNCIPSVSRYMAFPKYGKQFEALGGCASRIASAFLRFYGEKFEWPKFLVGSLNNMPWPVLSTAAREHFEALIKREVEHRRQAYRNHEPFHEFLLPSKLIDFSQGGKALTFSPEALLDETGEKMVADAYGFTARQTKAVERDLLEAIAFQKRRGTTQDGDQDADENENSDFLLDASAAAVEEAHLSYLVGLTFGRWDIRYATSEIQTPELSDPFAPLPACPHGMLQDSSGLPASPENVSGDYPLDIIWNGILVDDESHQCDIVALIRKSIGIIWKEKSGEIEQEACEAVAAPSFRNYFSKPSGFFADHLSRYTKGHRQAPIYWPLSTQSGSYTLWLYYHRLTDQILYTCINDFVEPKIKEVSNDGDKLRLKSGRNRQEEKELEEFTSLELELKDFRDELLRIAKFWKPNLNDGVQITAAPLWKLFLHRPWQNKLKDTWKKLEKGDYDWAHLAYSIWPERVVRKCHKDLSLAIAHDLENDLWQEVENGTDRQGNLKYKWVPRVLSKEAMNQLIQEKLSAM